MSVVRRKKESGERSKKAGGEVRISGGVFRGQKIKTPGGGTHPMGERERTALFNMISGQVEENSVIDLYCGGGTLGIEALSRGANLVLFVDNNPQAIKIVDDNLQKLGLRDERSRVVLSNVAAVVNTTADRYGIVIADPPYDKYSDEIAMKLPELMADDGILVLSHPGEAPEIVGLFLEKTRSYARANISIYRKTL